MRGAVDDGFALNDGGTRDLLAFFAAYRLSDTGHLGRRLCIDLSQCAKVDIKTRAIVDDRRPVSLIL